MVKRRRWPKPLVLFCLPALIFIGTIGWLLTQTQRDKKRNRIVRARL